MRNLFWVIIVGVVTVMSLTVGLYVALMKFEPEREIGKMLVAMSSVQNMKYNIAAGWSGKTTDSTTVYLKGTADTSTKDAVNHKTQFRLVEFSDDQEFADLSGELQSSN